MKAVRKFPRSACSFVFPLIVRLLGNAYAQKTGLHFELSGARKKERQREVEKKIVGA